jgi:hypothetical protein
MSDEQEEGKAPRPPKKKWSRKAAHRVIHVYLNQSGVNERDDEFEPWHFQFRPMLSQEANERREKWLGLSGKERVASLKEQMLDEVCDLMVAEPEGFEDFPGGSGAGDAGQRFRAYVTETTDPVERAQLDQMVEAANTAYWAKVTPREFRPAV